MTTSTPIRTVIVEDEPHGRAMIRELLRSDAEVDVIGECANGHDAIRMIESQHPDLVFLDVRMPEVDGFDVLSSLRSRKLPAVVFVTAYDEYAVRAFEVNAVDYLLKPFDRERFERALDRAKSQIHEQPASRYADRLVVKSGGRILFVRTADVDWIEAEGNYSRLHVGKESHLIRSTISTLEDDLDPKVFTRIHRSQIVNVDRIRELRPYWHGEYHVVLKDGTALTLSRSYRHRLSL